MSAVRRAKIVPADLVPPDELPDEQYPLVLTTGRLLEHWHTGSMTRRASNPASLEPEAIAGLNPREMDKLGVAPGGLIKVSTRRGEVVIKARADRDVAEGMVFIPFCYAEAAATVLLWDDHPEDADVEQPFDAPVGDGLLLVNLVVRVLVAEVVIELGQHLIAARRLLGADVEPDGECAAPHAVQQLRPCDPPAPWRDDVPPLLQSVGRGCAEERVVRLCVTAAMASLIDPAMAPTTAPGLIARWEQAS